MIELLVAMAVLALVSVVFVQILSGVQSGSRDSSRRVDAATQAAFVFEMIARDLSAIPPRADVPIFLDNPPNGESMRFLSGVEGIGGSRRLSVVSYKVDADPDAFAKPPGKPVLQRAALAQDWNAAGFVGEKGALASPEAISVADWPVTPASADYDVLGEGVFRMGLCYHLREADVGLPAGSVVAQPPLDTNGNPDRSKIGAITVALAILDLRSLALLTSAQLEQMASVFPVPTNGVLPKAAWQPIAENPGSFPGIPLSAAQGVRIYQQTFPLPNPL